MKVIVEAPINSVSFGNVTYNLLRQFWRRSIDVCWFPIGNPDISSFDKIDPNFQRWLQESAAQAHQKAKKDMPTFKLWHINGSQTRIGSKQLLYTFYELDQPTPQEVNLLQFQDKVMFSNSYAQNIFNQHGVESQVVPLGFDEDFFNTNKKYYDENIIHFGLMGKFEKRKHTEKIIKLWIKKYGNNNKYLLTLCVTNPFIKAEEMNAILNRCFEGKRYTNINIVPYLKKNSEVNELLNSIDIDLTGLSGAEGWNLPAFNATCLGKWSIVLNATSHKDWATKDNSIIVEPDGKEDSTDGIFFKKGEPYNQGNIFNWNSDTVSQAMDTAVSKKGQNNTEGMKLKDKFCYKKSASRILTELETL